MTKKEWIPQKVYDELVKWSNVYVNESSRGQFIIDSIHWMVTEAFKTNTPINDMVWGYDDSNPPTINPIPKSNRNSALFRVWDKRDKIIYKGSYYSLIKRNDELLIVYNDYFNQESSIVFGVGHPETDWSDSMLLKEAKRVIKFLNAEK